MRSLVVLIAGGLALGSCTRTATGGLSQCGRGTLGTLGGTVTSPSGASISIPAGALTTLVEVSVCVLAVGRVPRQRSPVIEFGPVDLPVRGVSLTLPVDDTSSPPNVAEVRRRISDDVVDVLPIASTSPGLATTTSSSLGDVRLMDTLAGLDASVDASGGADDVNRPDAPRPVGPVVVGPDLTPADYACLGLTPTPAVGPPVAVSVHVVDWADHGARGAYPISAAPSPTSWDGAGSCAGMPDCSTGTSDASGTVSLALVPGRAWFSAVPGSVVADAGHTPVLQWIAGISVAEGTTDLTLPVLSVRTNSVISSSIGFAGQFLLGQVRDCDGAPVQRVRVRIFDAAGLEQTVSFLGGPAVTYGNGLGFPGGAAERSTGDGLYFAPLNGGGTAMRVEAWGRLALGGSDLLLSCEAVSFPGFAPMLLDLRPLAADAPSTCGSAP